MHSTVDGREDSFLVQDRGANQSGPVLDDAEPFSGNTITGNDTAALTHDPRYDQDQDLDSNKDSSSDIVHSPNRNISISKDQAGLLSPATPDVSHERSRVRGIVREPGGPAVRSGRPRRRGPPPVVRAQSTRPPDALDEELDGLGVQLVDSIGSSKLDGASRLHHDGDSALGSAHSDRKSRDSLLHGVGKGTSGRGGGGRGREGRRRHRDAKSLNGMGSDTTSSSRGSDSITLADIELRTVDDRGSMRDSRRTSGDLASIEKALDALPGQRRRRGGRKGR